MSQSLSPLDAALLASASAVDVMDVAGAIIANPRRARISLADELAMALAVERLQAIAIEADLLVRALALLETGNEADMAVKDHAIATLASRLRVLIASVRAGETDTQTNTLETDHGHAERG